MAGSDAHCPPSMEICADSAGCTWKITGVLTAAT